MELHRSGVSQHIYISFMNIAHSSSIKHNFTCIFNTANELHMLPILVSERINQTYRSSDKVKPRAEPSASSTECPTVHFHRLTEDEGTKISIDRSDKNSRIMDGNGSQCFAIHRRGF